MEFEKAKQILNTESEKKFTDQEIIEIMQILEVFADVWVNNLLKSIKNKI
jgi:DNA-binding MltR family transcriptional regulator